MSTIAGSVTAGFLAAIIMTLPWALLARANVAHASDVPWAVPIAAVGLWCWWQYVNGKGPPQRTAAWRRANVRAVPVPDEIWGLGLMAGVLGIALSLLALNLANRVLGSQYVPLPTPVQIPPVQTALALNFMGAGIAGIVEEAAFRGLMQTPIERQYGPVAAIGISATAFWLAHLTRAGTTSIAPFYLTYGVVFGALAYFTGSIYPGIVLHASGDALAGLGALARPAAERATSPTSGGNVPLAIIIVIFAMLAVGTIGAFRSLARASRSRVDRLATGE